MSPMVIMALISLIAAGGAGVYGAWKGTKEHQLGMKGLDLQEKGMKMQGRTDIRAMREKKAMAKSDRKAALSMRRMDREYGRLESQRDRDMTERMMQMKIIEALMNSGINANQQRRPANSELSISQLTGVL